VDSACSLSGYLSLIIFNGNRALPENLQCDPYSSVTLIPLPFVRAEVNRERSSVKTMVAGGGAGVHCFRGCRLTHSSNDL
jgi:hypothetical protein